MKWIKLFEDFLNSHKSQCELNEYVSNDLLKFRNYLKSSKEEKSEFLPVEYPYLFDDFVSDTGYKWKGPKGLSAEKSIEWLEKNDKKIYSKFSNYLYDKIKNHTLSISKVKYPSWYFFESPELVKNQWLIHFTGNAKEIAKDGFKWGVNDPKKLGLTTFIGSKDKEDGGYNFAFLLSDFLDYYTYNSRYGPQPKYGNQAVVFKCSGLKVWHEGDQENQVVFYGKEAKDIVPIILGKKHFWSVWARDGKKVVYESDNIKKVSDWIANNYTQYKKHIK